MCCGTKAGSYLRLMDSCITQLKDQGPSRTCNESKEEEEDAERVDARALLRCTHRGVSQRDFFPEFVPESFRWTEYRSRGVSQGDLFYEFVP